MKKITYVIIVLIFLVFISGCLNYPQTNDDKDDFIYPEPDWVTEIKNKIDLEKCSADNCEACNEDSCKNYLGNCKIENKWFECGPSCDAAIDYCVNKEKDEGDNKFIEVNGKKISISCNSDSDCRLINKNLGFRCCWSGACGSVDYSLDKYISVNVKSFLELRDKNCPSEETCGPAPGCPTQIINNNFAAKCVNNICQKIPKENTGNLKPQEITEEDYKECINNLTNYYANQPGVISTRTGKIGIGFSTENKAEIIDAVQDYGLNLVADHGSFVFFGTPIEEELKWICILSNNQRIKNKIDWIEPNAMISGSGSS